MSRALEYNCPIQRSEVANQQHSVQHLLGILSLADLDDFGATYKAPTTLAQAVALAWDHPSQWFYPGLIVFEHMLATNALVLAAARTGLGLTIQAETLVDADIAEGR